MVAGLPRRRSSEVEVGSVTASVETQNDLEDQAKDQVKRRPRDSIVMRDGEMDEDEEEVKSLSEDSSEEFEDAPSSPEGERSKWRMIYALRFLFTWNTRTYEYASIVLIARAFPDSLTASSIRGITSTVSAMLCASAVGSQIDRATSRLPPLLFTIFSNHGAITLTYLCWLLWPVFAGQPGGDSSQSQNPFSSLSKGFLFGLILLLDVIQNLGEIANKLSLEQDCIPVLVGPTTPNMKYGLTQVNAVMQRIDLICKLVAPSLLPLIMDTSSSRARWILLLAALTILLWVLEFWCAHAIGQENPQLRLPKKSSNDPAKIDDYEIENQYTRAEPVVSLKSQKLNFLLCLEPAARFRHYFSMDIWPASLSRAIIHLTVLGYSATLITYLLEVGFSLSAITVARASGSIMALAGTFITPLVAQYLRDKQSRRSSRIAGEEFQEDGGDEGKVVRQIGLWGILSQFLSLVPVVIVLWNLSPETAPDADRQTDSSKLQSSSIIAPLILFSFLSLSRAGHWVFDLMIQELEQVEIPSLQRSTFAGTGQSLRSLFSLLHWTATMVWSQPEEFRWLALGSLMALGVAPGLREISHKNGDNLVVNDDGLDGLLGTYDVVGPCCYTFPEPLLPDYCPLPVDFLDVDIDLLRDIENPPPPLPYWPEAYPITDNPWIAPPGDDFVECPSTSLDTSLTPLYSSYDSSLHGECSWLDSADGDLNESISTSLDYFPLNSTGYGYPQSFDPSDISLQAPKYSYQSAPSSSEATAKSPASIVSQATSYPSQRKRKRVARPSGDYPQQFGAEERHLCQWDKCEIEFEYDKLEEFGRHVRSHAHQERRCKWRQCTSNSKGPLRKHLENHIKAQLCNEIDCGKRFAFLRDVSRHRVSHGVKPGNHLYYCPWSNCDYRKGGLKPPFSRPDNAARHIRNQHKNRKTKPIIGSA